MEIDKPIPICMKTNANSCIFKFKDFYEKYKSNPIFMDNYPCSNIDEIVGNFINKRTQLTITLINSRFIIDLNCEKLRIIITKYKNIDVHTKINFDSQMIIVNYIKLCNLNFSPPNEEELNRHKETIIEVPGITSILLPFHFVEGCNENNNLTIKTNNETYKSIFKIIRGKINYTIHDIDLFVHRIISICMNTNNALLDVFDLYDWVENAPTPNANHIILISEVIIKLREYLNNLTQNSTLKEVFNPEYIKSECFRRKLLIMILIKHDINDVGEYLSKIMKFSELKPELIIQKAIQIISD